MDMEHTEVEAAEPLGFFSSAREQKPAGFALGEPELELCMGGWGGMTALERVLARTHQREKISQNTMKAPTHPARRQLTSSHQHQYVPFPSSKIPKHQDTLHGSLE